ncbi:MAG: hypothetical protein R3B68_14560 [Phycisphaerales bacterium]
MSISPDDRRLHLDWLTELTQTPTAAGRESRVIAWIDRWLSARPGLASRRDAHANIEVSLAIHAVDPATGQPKSTNAKNPPATLYFTAHLDHPAFVVERIADDGSFTLEFRGGVGDDYFTDARITAITSEDEVLPARLTGPADGPQEPLKRYTGVLDDPSAANRLRPGDVARWDLPRAEIADITAATAGGAGVAGDRVACLHTDACDDLAAAAAALAAMDLLLRKAERGEAIPDVRLLFTRGEEVGFLGAIAACRAGFMPAGCRIIALENSRSFIDSPIGGGPIVRVGDRVTVFTPSLTAAIAKRCEEIGGAQPLASQKLSQGPAWKWQRKLMAGGACEASVFCEFGYEATCVCLPLGNYHNMADLEAVQAERNTRPARVGREFIAISDFEGLVDLLVACGERLEASGRFMERIDRIWERQGRILSE